MRPIDHGNHDRSRRSMATLFLALAAGLGTLALAEDDEVERLVEALALRPGMRVADVGAGDGEWSEALAERVGESGHVFATEIEAGDVAEIRDRLERSGVRNWTVAIGEDTDTGLPAGCCDAILLRLVYHHFTKPAKMRASLRRALRPGGRLVIVDIRPQSHWDDLEDVPDRGGHGIAPEDLIRELTGDGFNVVARHDEWPADDDHYCVVFTAGS